jgi:hypothetical protein
MFSLDPVEVAMVPDARLLDDLYMLMAMGPLGPPTVKKH